MMQIKLIHPGVSEVPRTQQVERSELGRGLLERVPNRVRTLSVIGLALRFKR